jgi:hypothetical protein
MSIIHRIRIILFLDRKKSPALVTQSKAIYGGVTGNAGMFPSISPAPPVVLAQIQDFEVAQQATKTGTRGTVAVRDAKREVLLTSLESWRMCVQAQCDGNPEQAAAIAAAACMTVAKAPGSTKPVLKVKQLPQSGSVQLTANLGLLVGRGVYRRVTLNWQYSADGGKTWTSVPSTPLATTEITGLTPLTTYSFRVSATVSKTVGEWSQAVSFLVR